MSINLSVGFQIPTNVVEVGNEITADQLAAITNTPAPSAANPFLTLAGGTLTGTIGVLQINNLLNTDLTIDSYNDSGAGTHYLHKFTPNDGKFNLATNGGGLVYPDGTTQTTAGYPNSNPSGYISSVTIPVKGVSTGSATIDESDNYYIYAIGGGETLTIDDEVNNNPAVGTELTVVSTSSSSSISCSGSVTCNGSSGFTLPANTVLKLVKLGTNAWWIG
jgi:hypothetical protein